MKILAQKQFENTNQKSTAKFMYFAFIFPFFLVGPVCGAGFSSELSSEIDKQNVDPHTTQPWWDHQQIPNAPGDVNPTEEYPANNATSELETTLGWNNHPPVGPLPPQAPLTNIQLDIPVTQIFVAIDLNDIEDVDGDALSWSFVFNDATLEYWDEPNKMLYVLFGSVEGDSGQVVVIVRDLKQNTGTTRGGIFTRRVNLLRVP